MVRAIKLGAKSGGLRKFDGDSLDILTLSTNFFVIVLDGFKL